MTARSLGSALKRRVAPAASLTLDYVDHSGARTKKQLLLSFDFNSAARVQELTDYRLTDLSIWTHITEPILLRAMLYCSLLAHQPEFATEDGLEIVGSWMDESNQAAIVTALEEAYLLWLPKEKREFLEKLRADQATGKEPEPDPTEPSQAEAASSAS
jgi:hypothetical protein